jgi:hypothetical protein
MLLAADPLIQATSWMEVAAKWGLGIVLSVLILALLCMIIKKIMNNVDKDRSTYVDLLKSRDITLNNHLQHVEENLSKVEVSLKELTVSGDKNTKAICKAIENQTKMLKEK